MRTRLTPRLALVAGDRAEDAADWLRARTGLDGVDAVLVLGSGWGPATEGWPRPVASVPTGEVPGLLTPVAEGHAGRVEIVALDGTRVLVLNGRTHLYEGHGPGPVVAGVRAAAAYGARLAILTNANGSLRPHWPLGTPLLIRDHVNLTGVSPLAGPEFVDLTDAWSPRLRVLARDLDPSLDEAVYALLRGPHYETLAEAAWVRRIGADVLGMSTVPEAIAARALGLEVLGLSTVTAIEGEPSGIDASEVVRIAETTARRLGGLLADLLTKGVS